MKPRVEFFVTRHADDWTHLLVGGRVARGDGNYQAQVYRLAADADPAEIAAMQRAIEMELMEHVAS